MNKNTFIILILNILFGVCCFAAGHITNKNFNEMIKETTTQQRKTASIISEEKTEAYLQDYLNKKPKSRNLDGIF